MIYDLRQTLYRLKEEDSARAAQDAKWRKEQEEARAKKEADLNSARMLMEAPEFLDARVDSVDKNRIYRLVHLLAIAEGINPFMSHLNSVERVSLFREAAAQARKRDCIDRLLRVETRLHEFEERAKFKGKTPETVEDCSGQRTLIASDFIEWARHIGWIPDSSHSETEATRPAAQDKCGAVEKATIPQGKTTNLQRAIFTAWDSGEVSVDAKSSELFAFLGKSDESGYICGVNGDEITWENTSGDRSSTKLKSVTNALPALRKRYQDAK